MKKTDPLRKAFLSDRKNALEKARQERLILIEQIKTKGQAVKDKWLSIASSSDEVLLIDETNKSKAF